MSGLRCPSYAAPVTLPQAAFHEHGPSRQRVGTTHMILGVRETYLLLTSVGKWSCGCPDDGVVNGIDAAFFDCPLTLCYLHFGIPIYISLPVVVLLSSLGVSTFLCSYLSLSLSSFLSVFLLRLLGFSSRTFLGLVPFFLPSFVSFFLNKNQTTVEWRPHWYRLQGHKICYKATNTEGSVYRSCSF